VGGGGGDVRGALGVRAAEGGGAAGGEAGGVGAHADRPVRAGEAGGERVASVGGGGQVHAGAAGVPGSDRAATDAGGGGCVCEGCVAGCVREAGGSVAGQPS